MVMGTVLTLFVLPTLIYFVHEIKVNGLFFLKPLLRLGRARTVAPGQ